MAFPEQIETLGSGSGSLTTNQDGLVGREVELRFALRVPPESTGEFDGGYNSAESKARAKAPMYYAGHRRTRLDVRSLGNRWYEVTAGYANAAVDYTDDTLQDNAHAVESDAFSALPGAMSFDTTGGTEKVTQAWTDSADPDAYVGGYADNIGNEDSAPKTHGAINVSGDTVQGVDITVPAFQFTETWGIPSRVLLTKSDAGEAEYIRTLYDMTGKVNSKKWRVFEPGEVLFLGARGELSRSQSMVQITYSFSARVNREDFFVGDIKVSTKAGWDYMWIEYETAADTERLFKRPKYVYVDRVYERRDFAVLGIGQDWPQLYLDKEGLNRFVHPLKEDQKDRL